MLQVCTIFTLRHGDDAYLRFRATCLGAGAGLGAEDDHHLQVKEGGPAPVY